LSEFLQHLVYYIAHNKDNKYSQSIVTFLLKLPLFFYQKKTSGKDEVTVWIDPKEEITPLFSLAMNGDVENFSLLLELCSEISDKTTFVFKDYLFHQEKNNYTALNIASKKGHPEIVMTLLTAVEQKFGGH